MKTKAIFFPGMGEKPKDYSAFSRYMEIANIDWNTDKYKPAIRSQDVLIGFSMGCYYPLTHALNKKTKKIILCSPPPIETLKKVKADEIIFLAGAKEKFVLDNIRRVAKELKTKHRIIVIPNTAHQINKKYRDKIIELT